MQQKKTPEGGQTNWDGSPREDLYDDYYPEPGRHLSPEAREQYYADRDRYYAERDAYYARRDAYYAEQERKAREEEESPEEYDEDPDGEYEEEYDEAPEEEEPVSYEPEDAPEAPKAPSPKKKKKKRRRRARAFRRIIVLLLLVAAALTLVGSAPKRNPTGAERIAGRSTVLLCGTDEDGTRTDTIVLLTLDRSEHTIRLLSIPRDTYAPDYVVPKINSAYGAVGGGEEGMEQLMTQVERVIGFMPDGYALIDLNAFMEAVDLLGGLDFDVPMDMDYDDPDQNLFIHLRAGEQHLNGEQLMWVVRFRAGYANADIGRTEVQRAVLKAAMKQWLRPKTLAAVPGLLRIYRENLTTDLTTGNLLWMARVAVLSLGSDIEANVLPGYSAMVGDASVYMIDTAAASAILPDYSPYK